ncbi:hypothetical protein BN1708_020300, partial [Verticillium longisporum]
LQPDLGHAHQLPQPGLLPGRLVVGRRLGPGRRPRAHRHRHRRRRQHPRAGLRQRRLRPQAHAPPHHDHAPLVLRHGAPRRHRHRPDARLPRHGPPA